MHICMVVQKAGMARVFAEISHVASMLYAQASMQRLLT